MGKITGQRQFQITPEISVHCQSENTSSGFRHLATVFKNGYQVGFAKATYQNRTWESYEYQSVLKRAIESSSLSSKEKEYAKRWADGDRTDWTTFNQTYGLAMMGDILGSDQKQKNELKTKALMGGLGNMGLDIPSDWGTLPESTKTARLNAVMDVLASKGKPKKKPHYIKEPFGLPFELTPKGKFQNPKKNNVTKQASALNKKIKEMMK